MPEHDQEDVDLWKYFTDSAIQFMRILITGICSIEQATLWRLLIFANKM